MRNQVSNTIKQHVTLHITHLNHHVFIQEAKKVKDKLHNS